MSMQKKKEKYYAFIDSQNLYLSISKVWYKLDDKMRGISIWSKIIEFSKLIKWLWI